VLFQGLCCDLLFFVCAVSGLVSWADGSFPDCLMGWFPGLMVRFRTV